MACLPWGHNILLVEKLSDPRYYPGGEVTHEQRGEPSRLLHPCGVKKGGGHASFLGNFAAEVIPAVAKKNGRGADLLRRFTKKK